MGAHRVKSGHHWREGASSGVAATTVRTGVVDGTIGDQDVEQFVVFLARHPGDHLAGVGQSDPDRVRWQQGQQSVVVAAAASQSSTVQIEGHSGQNHHVDLVERTRTAGRFGNPALACHQQARVTRRRQMDAVIHQSWQQGLDAALLHGRHRSGRVQFMAAGAIQRDGPGSLHAAHGHQSVTHPSRGSDLDFGFDLSGHADNRVAQSLLGAANVIEVVCHSTSDPGVGPGKCTHWTK